MLLSTTENLAGYEITESIGMVRGNVVRTKHIGKDIVATLRNLVGGEVIEYTSMMAGAREQATDRMIEEARMLGADAIVEVRFMTSMIMGGASEILAYGTAVNCVKQV